MAVEYGETPRVFGIVGPTGSGKTSLSLKLSERLGYDLYPECDPKDNPFLEDYYEELQNGFYQGGEYSHFVIRSQIHFLERSFQQGQQILKNGSGAIWDVPLRGHKMYADLTLMQKIMSPDDYQLYKDLYDAMTESDRICEPDITLVLNTEDINILHERIVARASSNPERASEADVDPDYWKEQSYYWWEQLAYDQTGKLVLIDPKEIDWVNGSGVDDVLVIAKYVLSKRGVELNYKL